MIKFFRGIRQKLLNENKTGKYLKYAIGEIVLVVIGILIALSINNWNEQKANKERFAKILKEMQTDLKLDIKNATPLLKTGKIIDSLCKKIINDEFTYDDYNKHDGNYLFWVGLQFLPFNYQTTAFNKLNNFQGLIPEEFNSIIKSINEQYINNGSFYNSRYEALQEQIKDRHDYLAENFEWYVVLRKRKHTDDMIDFYLNNPIYKNWVAQHKADNSVAPLYSVHRLQLGAVKLYFEIHKLFGETEIDTTIFGQPIGKANDYIGTYENEENHSTLSLTNDFGHLIIDGVIILKVVKKDQFNSEFINVYIEFNRDAAEKIIGFTATQDDQKFNYKKIETND